jgi:transcription-repair coupling factor (superfamily II helicase)
VENKVFRKTESFRLYFGENGAVYQNSEDLFSQLDKQFDRAEEAFENCQRTSNMPRQINYFKPKTFIKKALDFSIVELSVKPILESPINLNSTFSHNPHSTSNLICC